MTVDGFLSSSYLAAFRAQIDNSAATSTPLTDQQLILPPCYDSLQPLPPDYDKTLPPSYQDVVGSLMATQAAATSSHLPLAQSPVTFADATSGRPSSETAVSSSTAVAPAENASSDVTTQNEGRYNTVADQLDNYEHSVVAVIDRVDERVDEGGIVNNAVDLTDEDETGNQAASQDENRQTSMPVDDRASTSLPAASHRDFVLDVDTSIRTPTDS
jgi:hypothetical protein